MRNLATALFIFLSSFLFAQNNDKVVTEKGKTYCIHKIVAGETLYRLSVQYGVKVDDITKANKGLGNNLSLDQEIKIPCSVKANLSVKEVVPASETQVVTPVIATNEFKGNFLFHTVAAGETIYALSKKYNISEEQLYKDNEELKTTGLKVGEVIKVYKKETVSEDELLIERHFLNVVGSGNMNEFGADSNLLKDSTVFKLAVMLPFQYERNIAHLKKFKNDQEHTLYRETKSFLELYQGVRLAVDSAVQLGLKVQMFVYDTKADTNEIKKIIQKPEAKYFDLVIGPGYSNSFVFASKYFKSQGIPMLSPLSKKGKIIKGNPFAIQMIPSYQDHIASTAKYINSNYISQNIIIAMRDEKDRTKAVKMQREILTYALMNDSSANVKVTIVKGDFGVQPVLVAGKKNIVVLVNNEEAFASKLAARLVPKTAKNDIVLFGTEDLTKYKNIEVSYWDSLNIHVSSDYEIKYGYAATDQFISKYFKLYYDEPSNFAFSGYDLTLLILKQCITNKYNHHLLVGHYFVGTFRDYDFKYNGNDNGISNTAVSIYRFHNYKFIKVND